MFYPQYIKFIRFNSPPSVKLSKMVRTFKIPTILWYTPFLIKLSKHADGWSSVNCQLLRIGTKIVCDIMMVAAVLRAKNNKCITQDDKFDKYI